MDRTDRFQNLSSSFFLLHATVVCIFYCIRKWSHGTERKFVSFYFGLEDKHSLAKRLSSTSCASSIFSCLVCTAYEFRFHQSLLLTVDGELGACEWKAGGRQQRPPCMACVQAMRQNEEKLVTRGGPWLTLVLQRQTYQTRLFALHELRLGPLHLEFGRLSRAPHL
jgi:hypothetical protein